MLNTTLRWRSRSSMAAATMGSSKILPHEPTPRLVVRTVELFKYLVVMTWNKEAAASL